MLILTTINKKKENLTSTGIWKIQKPHRFCHRLDIDLKLELLYKKALKYQRAYLFPEYIDCQQRYYLLADFTFMCSPFLNEINNDENLNEIDDSPSDDDDEVIFMNLETLGVDVANVDADGDQIMDDNGESDCEMQLLASRSKKCQVSSQEQSIPNCPSSNQHPRRLQIYERTCLSRRALSSQSSSSCQPISPKPDNPLLESKNQDFPNTNSPPLLVIQNLPELGRLSLPPNQDLYKTNEQLNPYFANGSTHSSILSHSTQKNDLAATNNYRNMKSCLFDSTDIPKVTEGNLHILSFDEEKFPVLKSSSDAHDFLSHCKTEDNSHNSREFLNRMDLYPKDSSEICLLEDSAKATNLLSQFQPTLYDYSLRTFLESNI